MCFFFARLFIITEFKRCKTQMWGRKHSVLTAYIEQEYSPTERQQKAKSLEIKLPHVIFFMPEATHNSKFSKQIRSELGSNWTYISEAKQWLFLKDSSPETRPFKAIKKALHAKKILNYARHWFFALCCKRLPFNTKQ